MKNPIKTVLKAKKRAETKIQSVGYKLGTAMRARAVKSQAKFNKAYKSGVRF